MIDRVGQQLGNYRLLRLLGQGGFADVYLAEHVHLETQAAVKILHTKLAKDDVEAFRIEARTIARLEHPNIVRVLEFGIDGGTPFLVMSYAPNGSLRERHPRGKPLPIPTIISYVKQITDALQYAHDEKLIHRDVKPENMLVGRRNEVLLSDFGIALIAQSTSAQSKQEVIGTVTYMAPEQLRGKPRPASDQYALGIVVYEWLCGDRPFSGSFTEIAAQHMFEPPPPLSEKNPTIVPAIEQVVMIALAKEPQQRFATVHAFATALEQACFPVQRLPLVSPSQPLEPTVAAIPPTQHVWPPMAAASWNRTPEPAGTSTPSLQGERTKPGISRRAALAGLGGLTVVGLVGSITWLARPQSAVTPPVSLSSRQTPTTTPVTHPTPHSPPLGTTLLTYRGHSGWIPGVAWSPNGTHIASGSGDTTVQIFDATTGNNIFIYRGHSNNVNSVPWSPNGRRLASGSSDGTVQVWDATTGSNILIYRGHADVVRAVAWSPNGTLIASGSHDTTIQVWDASNGRTIFTYRGHTARVTSVAWSPDGTRIVSGSDDDTLQVWNASTGATILTYRSHSDTIESVTWSPNNTHIASGSHDRTAQVWSSTTGNNIFIYRGHSDWVNAVAWSPDGKHIASGSNDQTVQVWNASTGRNVFTYRGHSNNINAVGWSPDSAHIASGSGDTTVQVWQAS